MDAIPLHELETRINRARRRWPACEYELSWQVELLAELYGRSIHARRSTIALHTLPRVLRTLLQDLAA